MPQFIVIKDNLFLLVINKIFDKLKYYAIYKYEFITLNNISFHFSFILVLMRKVLAVASVAEQHKELVLKDLKTIFKRIKIPLDILLQEEISHS